MTARTTAKSFFPVQDLKLLRRAGGTPGCFLKQLVRLLRGLEWPERAAACCRWLTRTKPYLSRTPLYGALLKELTERETGVAEPRQTALRVIRRSQEKAGGGENVPRGERFSDFSKERSRLSGRFHREVSRLPKKAEESVPAGAALQLPAEAPATLLHRRGGAAVTVAELPLASPKFVRPPKIPEKAGRRFADSKNSVGAGEHLQTLREQLSRRVRKYLAADFPWSRTRGRRGQLSGTLPALPRQTTLDAQWNALLAAPQLIFFTLPGDGRFRPQGEAPLRDPRPGPVPGEPASPRVRPEGMPAPSTASHSPAAWQVSQQLSQSYRSEPLLATEGGEQRPRPPAAEPGRPEPSLRQLLQQAHARDGDRLLAPEDDPNPFTVEKQTVPSDLVGPEPGAVPPPLDLRSLGDGGEADELNGLAEKIGSILAAEARRHGIDV